MTSCNHDEPNVNPSAPQNPTGGGSNSIKHQHTLKASIDYSHTSMGRRQNQNIWRVDVNITLDNMVTGNYYTNDFSTTLYFEESSVEVLYAACWKDTPTIFCTIDRYKSGVELNAVYPQKDHTVTHKIHIELYTAPGVENLTLKFTDPRWIDMEYDKYGNETEVTYDGKDVTLKIDMSRVRIYDE